MTGSADDAGPFEAACLEKMSLAFGRWFLYMIIRAHRASRLNFGIDMGIATNRRKNLAFLKLLFNKNTPLTLKRLERLRVQG